MKISVKITAALLGVILPVLFGCVIIFIVIFQPIITAAKLWDDAMEYFGDFLISSEADLQYGCRKRNATRCEADIGCCRKIDYMAFRPILRSYKL